MFGHPRYKYVCVSCRLSFKDTSSCPSCRGEMRMMYNFQPPKRSDIRSWKKVELMVTAGDSGFELCRCHHCVPYRGPEFEELTLSQYRASIRRRRKHARINDRPVPKFYRYSF